MYIAIKKFQPSAAEGRAGLKLLTIFCRHEGLPMLKLILKRVPGLLALLFSVAFASFVLIHLAPGDFLSEISVNSQISQETLLSWREKYGLDQPWSTQFARWLKQILHG